ncbi:hypothetical protein EE612_043636, partial [Oryza sativa]
HRPCNMNHLFLVSDSNSELVFFYRMFYRSVSNYASTMWFVLLF